MDGEGAMAPASAGWVSGKGVCVRLRWHILDKPASQRGCARPGRLVFGVRAQLGPVLDKKGQYGRSWWQPVGLTAGRGDDRSPRDGAEVRFQRGRVQVAADDDEEAGFPVIGRDIRERETQARIQWLFFIIFGL